MGEGGHRRKEGGPGKGGVRTPDPPPLWTRRPMVQLKDRVKKLETTVKFKTERITALEAECNKDKLSKELESNQVNVIVDGDSKEQVVDGKFELPNSSAQADPPPPVIEHS